MRRSVPQKQESPVPRVGTRVENGSESRAEVHRPQTQQLQPQPRLPPLHSQPHDSQLIQRAATDPGQEAGSIVHSAHFPQSAVAPVAAAGHRVDLRTPQWPPSQSPAFQSVIGLSQIEQRYVDDDSRLPQSGAPRSQRPLPTRSTRLQPRPPAVDLSYPVMELLPVIPPSPLTDDAYSLPDSASPAEVLQSTVSLIRDMAADEIKQLHSSLMRQRRPPLATTPEEAHSRMHSSMLPSPSGDAASSAAASSLGPVLELLVTPLSHHPSTPWATSAATSSPGSDQHVSAMEHMDGACDEEQIVSFYHE